MPQTTGIAMEDRRPQARVDGNPSPNGSIVDNEIGRQELFARLAAATALNRILERPHITGQLRASVAVGTLYFVV